MHLLRPIQKPNDCRSPRHVFCTGKAAKLIKTSIRGTVASNDMRGLAIKHAAYWAFGWGVP